MTESTSNTIRLVCVLINDKLKIRDSVFIIKVPSSYDFGDVIHSVKEVTPSLKDKDHGKFRFYKPPSSHPVSASSFHGFQLTPENLGSPLLVLHKINEVFLEKNVDKCYAVDVVVQVNSEEQGTLFYL
jgi:hypothetical protein